MFLTLLDLGEFFSEKFEQLKVEFSFANFAKGGMDKLTRKSGSRTLNFLEFFGRLNKLGMLRNFLQ